MKDPASIQVRVQADLPGNLDALLRPSETLTAFASRCDASLAEYERTGASIPAAQVIAKLESKLAKRRKQLGG
jgi:hypothetical protein